MKRFVCAIALFALDLLAMFLFKSYPSSFFEGYRIFSKKWISLIAGICSPLKVAFWDIAAIILALVTLISLLYTLIRKKKFLNWLINVFLVVSVLVFAAINGWMLNHYAPTLSEEMGLEVKEYSFEELYETCDHYLLKAAEEALKMERDEKGHVVDSDFFDLAKIAGASYLKLEEKYPIFEGSSFPVKKLSVVGEYLMYNGIVGMFMPLTGEAGVPGNVPIVPMPFTMCHEAAHRLGLAKEEEANFAAFLSCVYNDDIRFVYSGYYNAFSYTFSSLYGIDSEKALELYHKYDDDPGVILLKIDRQDTAAIYRRYESPLKEVSDHINDTYLKTFDEEKGIMSYGAVTDYLIAWHLAGH